MGPSTPSDHFMMSGRQGLGPFRLALFFLLLLGIFSLIFLCWPKLDVPFGYRILILTGVTLLLLFTYALRFLRAWTCASAANNNEAAIHHRYREVTFNTYLLATLGVFLVLTFFLPDGLTRWVDIKVLSTTIIVLSLATMLIVRRSLRRKGEGGEDLRRVDSLHHRFVVSLIVFLLLPLYLAATALWPTLEQIVELRLLVLAITVASLLGFWSVRQDIAELRRIALQAQSLIQERRYEPLATGRDGELRMLTEALNDMLLKLQRESRELEQAKRRVELLATAVGGAVTSAGRIRDLQRLVLETCVEALEAQRGILLISAAGVGEASVQEVTHGVTVPGQEREARRKVEVVNRIRRACAESHFLALPLCYGGQHLGVLAVGRDGNAPPFSASDRQLLGTIATQTAIGLHASQAQLDEEQGVFESVATLALAVEARDPYMRGHSQRVSCYAAAIAREMGLSAEEVEIVRQSGLLHDIGRIGIPDSLRRKGTPLTPAEYDVARQHAITGELILRPLRSLEKLLPVIRHHHERIDGKGYPDGLSGESIDLKARILAVADAIDAMLSDRPYRKAFSLSEAMAEIRRGIGAQFDPRAAEALLALVERGELALSVPSAITSEIREGIPAATSLAG